MRADVHMHCGFSNDSETRPEDMVESAIAKGLSVICFTDHYDKDNLDWEIEAEDGIENFLICKFTLQPFLENSILHGISSGTPAVFISIHVLYGDDTVVISIEDNGAGMDSETLAQLRHAIEHNVIDYEKHFGISNVSSRISNPLYGNGSVRIRSNPGNGTYVTIEFEQMEEDIDEKNNDRR